MKGKTTMTVIIGLICVVLVSVMFMQFKTISRIDITALENMQEKDLRNEINTSKTKYEDKVKELEDINLKIAEFNENADNNRKISELLTNELDQLKALAGLKSVSGSGVVVRLEDRQNSKVYANNLLELVNELKLAGAEAISINGERIVYDSYISDVGGEFITINGERIVSPYEVKAIGNPTYLESGLSKKQYGYIDKQKIEYNITVTLERKNNITINEYTGDLNFKSARSINS